MKNRVVFALLAFSLSSLPAFSQTTSFDQLYGNRFSPNARQQPPKSMRGLDMLHRWNSIAIDATGLDHTPTAIGDPHVFGQQVGPGRAARAMAIVHVAMFDALNAINGGYDGYTNVKVTTKGAVSPDIAIAQAAHDALSALYPSQSYAFDKYLTEDLAAAKNPVERANGITLGKAVAAALLAARVGDGVEVPEPNIGTGVNDYHLIAGPGYWSWDPISRDALHQGTALGAHWGDCKPFVLQSGSQFRLPPPPDMTSAAYTQAFNDVKRLGGDGVVTPTQRTAEQTFIGTYWAYDGTPSLCAPPRMYNQITIKIGDQARLNTMQLARLLALVNVAMADAGIASWDSKFYWDFWRPITAIRQADQDGNGLTQRDPNYTPLGAPASNLNGPNFTPPFPSYPSGHATFGGAIFQVMRRFFGTDKIAFTFMSDEFNGTTFPAGSSTARPVMTRTFKKLSDAEHENAQSRIYLGIHWQFDADDGITLGNQVGNYVFDHAFRPK